MSEIRDYFSYLRWILNEDEIQESRVKDQADWISSLLLVGTILSIALMLELVWLGQRDQAGWIKTQPSQEELIYTGKQERAKKVGTKFVMNQEEWNG